MIFFNHEISKTYETKNSSEMTATDFEILFRVVRGFRGSTQF
jgi:hypothetical protein